VEWGTDPFKLNPLLLIYNPLGYVLLH
jgi:hypothetical protein